MSRSRARRGDVEALVAAYRADLLAAGTFADNPVTSVARVPHPGRSRGWAGSPLGEQCTLPLKYRRVVGWLIVTGRVRPTPNTWSPADLISARSPCTWTRSSTNGSVPPPPSSASTAS